MQGQNQIPAQALQSDQVPQSQPAQTPSQQVATAAPPQILMEAWTLFPFDLFPKKVRVTSVAVVIMEYFLFGEHHSETLMLKDLMTIDSGTSLFFGTLKLTPRFPTLAPITVTHLSNSDVDKLKNTIQGLLVLDTQEINTTAAQPKVVQQKAESLGQVTAT